MSRPRPRRLAAVLLPAALVVAVAGCGSDDSTTADRLDAVTIGGEVGSAPELDWKDQMSAGEAETDVVAEGDGAELADGDQVVVNFAVGNGYTESTSVDTYGPDTAGTLVTVGGEPQQPASAADILGAYVASQVEAGMTVGSRLAVTVSSQDAFGTPGSTAPTQQLAALAEFDIGNEDSLLFVIDLVSQPLDGPEGARRAPASWVPDLTTAKGEPTGFDFAGSPQPTDALRTSVLVQGDGEEVEKGDVLVANYLGEVYGGDEPFDDSYSRDAPSAFPIGLGSVVKGWDQALVGQTVGSRVVLAIPPKLGYGEQGSPQAGITGTDTLYFVIDILGAA